ncbi:mechanosensitive ion channel family protein [Paraburkholderia sp. DHOC27]|uniref:mechanosensitive ion channel family protein n=1 Tax=Paraburkholderia sp. DHOC27 TaxID=2303330 RepID=UPI000E3D3818|nr:mechanosensitive ion channel family protein [Paraburkholderia sp. DHOC27]RFU46511.1 mechanosensitive ion channel protein MscS [Paraburkholderia sp. DHOC27]
MFDNVFRIVTDANGHRHIYAYTDSVVVATVLVAGLLLGIVLCSALCYYITRFVLLRIVGRFARGEGHSWLRAAVHCKVFDRLAPLVPAYIVCLSAPLLSGLTIPVIAALGQPVETLAACYMVVTALRAAFAFLRAIEDRYRHFPYASEKPIKSFLQVATIVLYLVALITGVSILLHRSPTYFLTGVSAMTALLIIIFRDSLLGFVASIQLAAYDMLRVGDWVEVPGFVADGTVIDIALNTITVRNFDNTIVTMPSHVILTNGVKNWRGMTESGGRRIKHAIYMDTDHVRFCDDALLTNLRASLDLAVPIAAPVAAREETQRLTNLGMFRLYLVAYFRQHPAIRPDMPLVVRLLEATQQGLPIEIFAYINEVDWEAYEHTQSTMMDHVYGVLPQFGLRVWQKR